MTDSVSCTETVESWSNERLEALRVQCETSGPSLAAKQAYINGLEHELLAALNAAGQSSERGNAAPDGAGSVPAALYVWLVPSEHMLDQPGSWRIRKWDTEPFPEATHVAQAELEWDGFRYQRKKPEQRDSGPAPVVPDARPIHEVLAEIGKDMPAPEAPSEAVKLAEIARKWCPDAPLRCVSAIEEALSVPRYVNPPSATDLLGAVARGWCHPKNEHKTMDPDLAISIAAEVSAALLKPSPFSQPGPDATGGSTDRGQP